MIVPVKLDNGMLPKAQSTSAAGSDIHASQSGCVRAGERLLVETGIRIQLAEGYYAKLEARSGLACKFGIMVQAGVIDSDYRGMIKVLLYNSGKVDYVFEAGDRIAQLIVLKHETPTYERVDELNDTQRSGAGFGSTGK
jgi:dUTP pyrophosphatase